MARLDAELKHFGNTLPRLFLLESEYLLVMLEAELQWVRALANDLRSGEMTRTDAWLHGFIPPEPDR